MFRLINFEAGKVKLDAPNFRNFRAPQVADSVQESLGSSAARKETIKKACAAFVRWFRVHHQAVFFVLWLIVGWLYYAFHPGEDLGGARTWSITGEYDSGNLILGFYEAITIGYSVGLSPRNPDYMPNPWFSSAYILVGASLIAVILISLGQTVEESASDNLFHDIKLREKFEKRRTKGGWKSVKAFLIYNLGYLVTIILWIVWLIFIIVWSIIATSHNDPLPGHQWGFAYAQYFAVSLCSSAGSFSLPSESPIWAYLLAGISMAIGVPLMALAISSIVIMCMAERKYLRVKRAAYHPVKTTELELLREIGLASDDAVFNKGDFVLLAMLRLGSEAGLIKYLSEVYDNLEERGGNSISSFTQTRRPSVARRVRQETVSPKDMSRLMHQLSLRNISIGHHDDIKNEKGESSDEEGGEKMDMINEASAESNESAQSYDDFIQNETSYEEGGEKKIDVIDLNKASAESNESDDDFIQNET